MAKKLSADAKEFKYTPTTQAKPIATSASPSLSNMGLVIDGTDHGAISKEYFVVEGQTLNYRTVLPHGHITLTMHGQIDNISYTTRENKKIAQVTDWTLVQADSAPIYNAMVTFIYGPQHTQ